VTNWKSSGGFVLQRVGFYPLASLFVHCSSFECSGNAGVSLFFHVFLFFDSSALANFASTISRPLRHFLTSPLTAPPSTQIAGDVSDDVLEMIEGEVGVLKGIPADNVELVEEKKKKGGE
jgi:hypothetical protein